MTPPLARRRVLVVNVYFDELRRGARPFSVPASMAPVYLAAAFDETTCDVRLCNEQTDGPLADLSLLAWAELLVFTGLTASLDRMRQLTAYARTLNPRVVVAAGGPAVRAFPRLAAAVFDYACVGDVEEMQAVARDALGEDCVASFPRPRFDLAHWLHRVGYVESSRYCNFRCSFCSLTGEGRKWRPYAADDLRRQVLAVGRRDTLILIDNNFYGTDRASFLARVEALGALVREGHITGWSALVANDFFLRDDNLSVVREHGCRTLFSGVESLDPATLRAFHKLQNTRVPQLDLIRKCLDARLGFFYGLIFDPGTRHVADMRAELDLVFATHDVPLPTFASLAIPIPGTPLFRECVADGRLLPLAKLRDFDGSTVVVRPLDPMEEVVAFARELLRMSSFRGRAARHALGFWRRRRTQLVGDQMITALMRHAQLVMPSAFAASGRARRRDVAGRTFVTTTERLDAQFTPSIRVDARFQNYFAPTMITDAAGALDASVAPDLLAARDVERLPHVPAAPSLTA